MEGMVDTTELRITMIAARKGLVFTGKKNNPRIPKSVNPGKRLMIEPETSIFYRKLISKFRAKEHIKKRHSSKLCLLVKTGD